MTELNWVDDIILGIFILSMLAGLWRGFIREIILFCTWIAGLIIATQFAAPMADAFTHSSHVKSAMSSATANLSVNPEQSISWLAIGVSFVILFVITAIIGRIIAAVFSKAVDSTGLGLGNRLLGGIFGLGRGFLINLTLIFVVQLVPGVQAESWWTQASLVSQFQPAVQWLGNIVQPGMESLKSKMTHTMEDVTSVIQNKVGS